MQRIKIYIFIRNQVIPNFNFFGGFVLKQFLFKLLIKWLTSYLLSLFLILKTTNTCLKRQRRPTVSLLANNLLEALY
jgi:hypothetical protein